MTTSSKNLQALHGQYPEWAPWLCMVGEVLRELETDRWDAAVPRVAAPRSARVPLLAHAHIEVKVDAVAALAERLIATAAASGAPAIAQMRNVAALQARMLLLFEAAVDADAAALPELASACGVEVAPLRAVAALVPIPFLHACRRAWSDGVPPSWAERYCPVCGSWPTSAEVCGVERTRYLRCGRCGSAWHVPCLSCTYCGTTDHDALGALVTEQSDAKCAIEVCNRCHGYLKAFTKLSATPPAGVIIDDLASVELDIAAAARGYRRPAGTGYALSVKIAAHGAGIAQP